MKRIAWLWLLTPIVIITALRVGSGPNAAQPNTVYQGTSPWVVSVIGGGSAVNCGSSGFVLTYGCAVDYQASSNFATAFSSMESYLSSIATNTGNFNDPCSYAKKSFARFQATSGSATQIVAAVSGQFIYVCGYTITTSTQTNFGLIAGGGSNCASSTYDVWGDIVGQAAASGGFLLGPGVSTAGGIAQGNGGASLGVAGTANTELCYEFTTTNSPTVTGQIAYVQTAN